MSYPNYNINTDNHNMSLEVKLMPKTQEFRKTEQKSLNPMFSFLINF